MGDLPGVVLALDCSLLNMTIKSIYSTVLIERRRTISRPWADVSRVLFLINIYVSLQAGNADFIDSVRTYRLKGLPPWTCPSLLL